MTTFLVILAQVLVCVLIARITGMLPRAQALSV